MREGTGRLFSDAVDFLFLDEEQPPQERCGEGVAEGVDFIRAVVNVVQQSFCVFFRQHTAVDHLSHGTAFVAQQHTDGLDGQCVTVCLREIFRQVADKGSHTGDVVVNLCA